jgi:tetratricopeptide (TPR) repeat protein
LPPGAPASGGVLPATSGSPAATPSQQEQAQRLEQWLLAAAGELATVSPKPGETVVLPELGCLPAVPGYEIEAELGRGGMGVVYKARQAGLNRPVALKMILAGGHAGAEDLARFQSEAKAIARLQHANIVQVHAVGQHEGKPFFSLEFCAGGSLDKRLAGTPQPARESARLVEVLARAMQAAHEKGVIHRDLKPANVLLTADGTPKVTDFGLAKKLDEAGQTASGAVMGTPSYMAPEQAQGETKKVGPAADVYALGAILYECLTGRPPFKAATKFDTILQVLADEPVPVRRLQPKVSRDLETICLTCLHKNPARRYASAAELADDLRRYSDGRPISARPTGPLERGLKWARRRPSALAALLLAAVAGVALVGSFVSVFYTSQLQRALLAETAAKDEASHQEERAKDTLRWAKEALGISLTTQREYCTLLLRRGEYAKALPHITRTVDLYERLYPSEEYPTGHPDIARSLNDLGFLLYLRGDYSRAQCHLEQSLVMCQRLYPKSRYPEGHPALADCLNTLGALLKERGKYREAGQRIRQALAIHRKILGEEHLSTARSYNDLAANLAEQGKYREALPLCRVALAIRRKELGEEQPDTADSYNTLASSLNALGKYGEALPLYRKALAIRRKALGEEHPDTADSYSNVASCLQAQARPGEARPLLQKALAIRRKALGEGHPYTARVYDTLASCLNALGKYGEALPLYRNALAIRLKALGEGHPHTAASYNNLAACLQAQGKPGEALSLFEKALTIRLEALGERHPNTADSYNDLASCLFSHGKAGEALPLFRRALVIRSSALGQKHPSTATSHNNVAFCLDYLGRHGEALPLHRKALAIRLEALGERHPHTAQTYNNGASCLGRLGKSGEALPLFRRALTIRRQALGDGHPHTALSYDSVASCLQNQGKYIEALPLYKQALAIRLEALGGRHPDTATSYNSVAYCLHAQSNYEEALPLYRRALAIRRAALGEEHPDTAQSYNNLASCLDDSGRRAEALRLLQASLPAQEAARFHTASSGFDRAIASAGKQSPHAMLAVGLALMGQPGNAFRHAEFTLARGLLDDLAGADPAERQRIAALSDELRRVRARLAPLLARPALSDAQSALRDRLNSRRRELESELARLASAFSARQMLPLRSIQRRIPADAALVLWVDELGEHLGCVLRREGPPAWLRLTGSGKGGAWTAEDRTLPARCHATMADPAGGTSLRGALYRQRLAPLEGYLKGVRRLLVVAAGPMAFVPVEALSDRWLVSYVPSGSAFARAAEKPRKAWPTTALVLADPAFTRSARVLGEEVAVIRAAPPVKAVPPHGLLGETVPPHGILVKSVLPGGLAARVSLLPGDVLLEYAGRRLKTPADIADPPKGEERVAIKLWREGKVLKGRVPAGKLGVVLDPRPLVEALKAWRAEGRWAPLPGTRMEADCLTRLVGAGRTTRLLGSAASEQKLEEMAASDKLKSFRLLHLATHSLANPASPLDIALALAQDRLPTPREQEARVLVGKRPLEGRLTVDTILRTWRLDADLVTLSACQSGLGKETKGEGMLGFAQALLQKGARSVLLSRWKVDDSATALLMVRFYENLLGKRAGLKKPLPKAEALREAKGWLRGLSQAEAQKILAGLLLGVPRGERGKVGRILPFRRWGEGNRPFAHPYYWAAFVLIGDPT